MHVLLIVNGYVGPNDPHKGAKFHTLARALRSRGHQVGALGLSPLAPFQGGSLGSRFVERQPEGIPVFEDHLLERGQRQVALRPGLRWLFLRRSRGLFRRYVSKYGRPDVIHAHAMLRAGVAAECISREAVIPYVLTEHVSAWVRGRVSMAGLRYGLGAMRGARRVTAVGPSLRKALEGLGSVDVMCVPNPVDRLFLELPMGDLVAGTSGGPFRYITVGRLVPEKRQALLVEAFSALREEVGQSGLVELVIIGEGPERGRLERAVRLLGLSESVRLAGAVPPREVAEEMQQAHAFVLASSVETFGIPVVEAQGMGLPVVVTVCGGAENLVDEESGLVVGSGDVRDLAEAMAEVRGSWERYDRSRIRARAKERFGPDAVAATWEQVYLEALSEGEVLG